MKLSKREVLLKKAEVSEEKSLWDKGSFSPAENRLFIGSFMGNLKYLIQAIKEGASIHAGDERALEFAAKEGNFDIVKFLLENGADPSARNYAAYKAALKGYHKDVADLLLKNTPLKHQPAKHINENLLMAAALNNKDELITAIEKGADIHYQEDRALELAAKEGNLGIVEFLLENGANPAARDFAAIKAAEESGHKIVADFISKHTPIGTEEYAPSFEIPDIIQRKQLTAPGQGFRQPIKKDPFPEELIFAPEKDDFKNLGKSANRKIIASGPREIEEGMAEYLSKKDDGIDKEYDYSKDSMEAVEMGDYSHG